MKDYMDEGYCADALNFIMTVANVIVSCFLGLKGAVLCCVSLLLGM